MTGSMTKYPRLALGILLLVAALMSPATLQAATLPADSGGATSPATTGTTSGDSAPITLSPEQIQAMQDAANGQNNSRSVFEKVSDFVTDKAPFFIIGIIVLAAIIAGILILRGRSGPSGSGPSAAERRRRKRIETQRARQEERLRRQARRTGGPAPSTGWSDPARDAVAAEKAGADQAPVAGVVARAERPVAAPYSPTQTAPAPGVVTVPPVAAAAGTAGPPEAPTANMPLPQSPGAAGWGGADPEFPEPSVEAPGADATVGRNAAAFAAAAGARSVSERIHPGDAEAQRGYPSGARPQTPPASGAGGPVADDRLRATLDDLRGVPGPVEPAGHGQPGTGESRSVESELSVGLAAVERRLSQEREDRDLALRDAEERLRRVEQRAEDAERRAAFAERLTRLKLEESDRDQRLRDVISGIERAEQRAEEAESRARSAELSAAAALDRPAGPITEDRPVPPPPRQRTEPPRVPAAEPEAAPPERERPVPDSPRGPEAGRSNPGSGRSGDGDKGPVSLNQATFEQLRGLGLSVTQATRILAYRERFGGYSSLDDLDRVPGFSPEKIESMRSRFTV